MAATLTPQDAESFADSLVLSDLAAYVGSDRAMIPYHEIASITAIKLSYDFTIHHRGFPFLRPRRRRVVFRLRSIRDVALAHVERKLGFRRHEAKSGIVGVTLWPLCVSILGAAFTYVSVGAARLIADGDERYFYRQREPPLLLRYGFRPDRAAQALIPAFRLLGPTGVTVVGCLFLFACVLWWRERIRQRPIMITLSRNR